MTTQQIALDGLDRPEKITWLKKHGVTDTEILDALLAGGDDALNALAER